MVRRQKIHALVLSRKKVGEADRLITFFSREHGILKVIAKGVRRIPSRRGGHIEPLTLVLAIINGSRGSSYLAAVDVLDYYVPLRDNPVASVHAERLAGLVASLFEQREQQEQLFDVLEESWRVLPTLSLNKQALLETTVTLLMLRAAGLQPRLAACQVCGAPSSSDAVILDPRQGGWHCLPCHHSLAGTGVSLHPSLLKVVRFVSRYPEQAVRLRLSADLCHQLLTSVRHYASSHTS